MSNRTANPDKKYFLLTYVAYEEGNFVSTKGVIIRGGRDTTPKDVVRAVDSETKEGSFPPELAAAMETDTFGGDSVERSDPGFYYVTGTPDFVEEGEWPTFIVRYNEMEVYESLEDAEDALLNKHRVYDTPELYALDRGGLREFKRGGKKAKANPKAVAKKAKRRKPRERSKAYTHAVIVRGPRGYKVGDLGTSRADALTHAPSDYVGVYRITPAQRDMIEAGETDLNQLDIQLPGTKTRKKPKKRSKAALNPNDRSLTEAARRLARGMSR